MCTVNFFFGKTRCDPRAPKGVKKPLKSPKLAKITLFALYLFIHPSDVFEILPKFEDTCYEHKSITVDSEKTLVPVPWGLLGLKIPLWGAFLMFVQNVTMYVVIVVFYSAEFKFRHVIT